MAAVRSKSGKMGIKLNGNPAKRQEKAVMPRDDVDDDLDSDADVSDVATEESSVEENDQESVEEESEGEDVDESENSDGASDDEMDEVDDEEDASADELEDSEAEEDTTDDEMDDDDAEGETWMDVEDDNPDHSSGSSSDEDESGANSKSKLHGNEGWADAMSKILRSTKPKGKKNVVLAKAKKLSQIAATTETANAKQDYGFEIENKDDEEDVKPNVDELDVKPNVEELDVKPITVPLKKRDRLAEGKVKPTLLTNRELERALSKIATKGVVQLFNAVRQQQKTLHGRIKEAKGSIVREDKVLKSIDKRAFLDVLMGAAPSEKVENYVETKTEKEVKEEEPATWSVLRDNFLTGSNLKGWDKCGEIKIEDDADEVELN